tara:strand:+ start:319 stop:522 length:204 start_codon:yes stop_codon:yes gene_type:complete
MRERSLRRKSLLFFKPRKRMEIWKSLLSPLYLCFVVTPLLFIRKKEKKRETNNTQVEEEDDDDALQQ